MLAAQFGLELKLLLRNGEQLLLTMFIRSRCWVGMTLLPLGSFSHHRAATFVPVIMALAVISTASPPGDRGRVRSPVRGTQTARRDPAAGLGIIAGKSLAVVAVVFLQAIILGAIGLRSDGALPRLPLHWAR